MISETNSNFYNLYSDYIKKYICDFYNENPHNFIYNVENGLNMSHKINSNNDILFYSYNQTLRIEVLIKNKENVTFENLQFRALDYQRIWEDKKWNKKYVLYSDMDYDEKHIINY